MFGSYYKNKKVLVTGHTGFKGSWLCQWLLQLGADVCGVSLEPNSSPALFNVLRLDKKLEHHIENILNAEKLDAIFENYQPEIVFHLAAQPLVRLSYDEPKLTWETNVIGTVNVLEAVKKTESVNSCIVITTDKCYENKEWCWGYRETDHLGGHDPYSASKGAAEIVVSSYRRSFLQERNCKVASARAGNVIGGGDWSKDRIVVDFVKSIEKNEPVYLRNPKATRPWQHVLEPLSGYLTLPVKLNESVDLVGAYNFGPKDDSVIEVESLAKKLVKSWGKGLVEITGNKNQPHEANLLKLDCSKAKALLGWEPKWGIDRTVEATVEWYSSFYDKKGMEELTSKQIKKYQTS